MKLAHIKCFIFRSPALWNPGLQNSRLELRNFSGVAVCCKTSETLHDFCTVYYYVAIYPNEKPWTSPLVLARFVSPCSIATITGTSTTLNLKLKQSACIFFSLAFWGYSAGYLLFGVNLFQPSSCGWWIWAGERRNCCCLYLLVDLFLVKNCILSQCSYSLNYWRSNEANKYHVLHHARLLYGLQCKFATYLS